MAPVHVEPVHFLHALLNGWADFHKPNGPPVDSFPFSPKGFGIQLGSQGHPPVVVLPSEPLDQFFLPLLVQQEPFQASGALGLLLTVGCVCGVLGWLWLLVLVVHVGFW